MLSRVVPAPTQMNGFLLIIITTAETRPRSFPLYEKKHDRGVDTQREEGACCTASLSTVLVQCTLPLHAVSSGVVPAPSSPLKHGVLLPFSQQTHLHPVQVETFPTMILNKNGKDRTTTLHPLAHAPPPSLPHSKPMAPLSATNRHALAVDTQLFSLTANTWHHYLQVDMPR